MRSSVRSRQWAPLPICTCVCVQSFPKRIWAYGNVLLFLRGLDFTSSIKVESDLLWDNRSLSTEAAVFIPRIRYLFGVSAGYWELWHLSAEMIDAVLYPLSNISLLLDSGQKSIICDSL